MSEAELEHRVAELEARVAALEAPPAPSARSAPAAPSRSAAGGTVGYQGTVLLHGEVRWEIEYSPGSVLGLPDQSGSAVLAALGHPVRAALARRLLAGPASTGELQQAAGLSSTGQLYHHLRSLTGVGIAEQDGRGSYRVPPRAVVPTLVLLLAAGDLAGDLGT